MSKDAIRLYLLLLGDCFLLFSPLILFFPSDNNASEVWISNEEEGDLLLVHPAADN